MRMEMREVLIDQAVVIDLGLSPECQRRLEIIRTSSRANDGGGHNSHRQAREWKRQCAGQASRRGRGSHRISSSALDVVGCALPSIDRTPTGRESSTGEVSRGTLAAGICPREEKREML